MDQACRQQTNSLINAHYMAWIKPAASRPTASSIPTTWHGSSLQPADQKPHQCPLHGMDQACSQQTNSLINAHQASSLPNSQRGSTVLNLLNNELLRTALGLTTAVLN
jgi:hypothetical protein